MNKEFNFVISREDKTLLINEDQGKIFDSSMFMDLISFYSSIIDLPKGSRVGVMMENRAEWVALLYAIWDKDCVIVPLDYMRSKEEIKEIALHADLSMIFISNFTKDNYNKKDAINVDELKMDRRKISKKDNLIVNRNLDENAAIIYTSGTSGRAEGVLLTKRNLLFNTGDIIEANNFTAGTAIYTFIPLFHSAGFQSIALSAIAAQFKIVFSNDLSSSNILNILSKYKIELFGVIPRFAYSLHQKLISKIYSNIFTKTLFRISRALNSRFISKLLFRKIYNRMGGNIKQILSGGSSLDRNIQRDLAAMSINIYSIYGLTETSPVITYSLERDLKFGSVGRPLPSINVKLVDKEIWVKGESVFKGYYKSPKKTEEAFEDGWFKTGDLGYFKNGYLYISGRKKEVIVLSNGKNIWPTDIEEYFEKNFDVIEESLLFEDKGLLKLVVKPDEKIVKRRALSNLADYIKNIISDYNISIPNYRKIQDVLIINRALPRTGIGKLKRFKLKDILSKKSIEKEEGNKIDSDTFRKLEKFMKEEFGKEIFANSHMDLDINLDSIEKIDLLQFISKEFNVKYSAEDLSKLVVIKDLVKSIEKGLPIEKRKSITISHKRNSLTLKSISGYIRAIFKPTAIFKQTLDPNRSYILAANHLSMLDWYFVYSSLPKDIQKKTLCLAKDKLLKGKLQRALARRSNLIIFDIEKEFEKSVERTEKAVKDGYNVVIFPEGSRSRDGSIKKFKDSFAKIAKRSNVSIIPIKLEGLFEILPPGKILPKRGPSKIIFGKEIPTESLTVEELVDKTVKSIEEM